MWLILAGTLGAALLVDQQKNRKLTPELGAPQQFKGFTIRFPQGWVQKRSSDAPLTMVELVSKETDERMRIMVIQPTFGEMILGMSPTRLPGDVVDQIPFGDVKSDLYLYAVDDPLAVSDTRWSIARRLPEGGEIRVVLSSDLGNDGTLLQRTRELLKAVCGSFQAN